MMDPKNVDALSGIRSRILKNYRDLSPQLQIIAQFATANPDAMAMHTAKQLADIMKVQPSSIVRFAQAIGYTGFNEMKSGFRQNLIYRMGEARDREQLEQQPSTGTIAVLDAMLTESRQSLDRLAKNIDRRAFEKAVSALSASDVIYVIGQQSALPFAALFAWLAMSYDRRCILLDNVGGYSLRMTELCSREDSILAISFSPYQSSVVRSARQHYERGGVVVSLTDSVLSPLGPVSSVLLEVPHQMPTTAHAMAGIMCVVQGLAVATGEKWREMRRRTE